MNYSSAI